MKTKSMVILGFSGVLAIILTVFLSSGINGGEKAIPVIMAIEDETTAYAHSVHDYEKASPEQETVKITSENTETAVKNPVELNSADLNALLGLEGIEDNIAREIIRYRNENGDFRNLNELYNIKGVNDEVIRQLNLLIYIDEVNITLPDTGISHETSGSVISDANPPPARNSSDTGLINLNSAGTDELMTLSGVGEVIAKEIYDYARNTGFKSVDDLINVSGIGEKKLENIRPYVCVE